MSMEILNALNGAACACGKKHSFSAELCIGSGVISRIPNYIRQYNAQKVFILSDTNTYAAAGKQVCDILSESCIPFTSYSFTHFPVGTIFKRSTQRNWDWNESFLWKKH